MFKVCPRFIPIRLQPARRGTLLASLLLVLGMALSQSHAQNITNILGFAKTADTVMESEGTATVTVVRKEGWRGRIEVDVVLNAAGNTNISGFTSNKVVLVDYQLSTNITVNIAENTSTNATAVQTAEFELKNPRVGAGEDPFFTPILDTATAKEKLTVINNDDPFTFNFERINQSGNEGENVMFAVTLAASPSASMAQNVSVDYQVVAITSSETAPGAALAAIDTDVPGAQGTISFGANDTRMVVSVPTTADNVLEFDEEFKIVLSNPKGDPADPTNSVTYKVNSQSWARGRILFNGNPPAAGANDSSFNPENQPSDSLRSPGANGPVNAVFVDASTNTYLVGSFTTVNATPRGGIAKMDQNGALDKTTFVPSGANGAVNAIQVYTNGPNAGKVVIGGSFDAVNGQRFNSVARLLPNGQVDNNFLIGAGAGGANHSIYAVDLENDGSIIVGGDFESFDGISRGGLARLHPDGSLDLNSFQRVDVNGPILSVLVQENREGGVQLSNTQAFTNMTAAMTNDFPVALSGGALQFTYNSFDEADHVQIFWGAAPGGGPGPLLFDGILTNNFNLVTNQTTAEVTTNWLDSVLLFNLPANTPPPGQMNRLTVILNGPDGPSGASSFSFTELVTVPPVVTTQSITVGGDFTEISGHPAPGIARFDATGELDAGFLANIGSGADGPVNALALQESTGKMLVGGAFRNFNNVLHGGIVRLNADGTPDSSFSTGVGADGSVLGLAIDQSSGGIYVAGEFQNFNGTPRRFLTRLFPEGHIDTGFFDPAYNQYVGFPNVNGLAGTGPEGYLSSVALAPDGKVVVGGLFDLVGGGKTRTAVAPRQNIARLVGGTTAGPGNIQLTERVTGVDEDGGTKPMNFQRLNGNLGEADAFVQTFDSAAVAGQDYTARNNAKVAFSIRNNDPVDGSTADTSLGIQITDDTIIEGNEDFLVDILGVQGVINLGGEIIRPGVALGTNVESTVFILENDVLPTVISFARPEYDVDEDDGVAVIEVYRTGNADTRVTVDYQAVAYAGTNGPAATPGVDFVTVTNTLVFNPGQTNRFFNVTIRDDEPTELDEKIGLRLTRPTAGAILDTNAMTAELNLIDNDLPSGKLDFTKSAYSVTEGQPYVEVQVRRSGGNVGFLTVDYVTDDASASTNAPADYVHTTGRLTWNNQDISIKTVRIPIVNDDQVETNETFKIRLLNPSTPGIIGNLHTNCTITITDDDKYGVFSFSVADYFADEDGANAVIQVIRRGGQAGQVSVDYYTQAQNAVPGVDYTNVQGTLVFGTNETAKSFVVPIVDDLVEETNKIVTLVLTNASLATIATTNNTARLVILDNETLDIPAGDVEKDFAIGEGANGRVNAIALQQDGPTNANRKIVIAGAFTQYNNIPREHVARLNDDGQLDTRYANNLRINGNVQTVLGTADGKLVIGGQFTSVDDVPANRIARLNNVGHRDTLFDIGSGADGVVNSLAQTFIESGTNRISRIVVGGAFTVINSITRPRIALLGDDGKVDLTFDPGQGPNAPVTAVAAQRNGKILVGGTFTSVAGTPRLGIARLNLDGSVDTSFDPGSGVVGTIKSIVIEADDKILIGGSFTNVSGFTRPNIARLNPDGSVDTTFDPGTGANSGVNAIALQPDGTIIVTGSFTNFNNITRPRITRLLPNGQNDLNINFGSGANAEIAAVAVQYDRKIVIGGDFTTVNGFPRSRVARIFGGSVRGIGRIQFFISDYEVLESAGKANVIVQRFGGTESAASVEYFTQAETAEPDSDYQDVSGVLEFGPGETVRIIQVPILDDNAAEETESILVTLTNVTGSVIGRQPIAHVRIISDDAILSFSQADYVVNENIQDQRATITVVRSGDLSFPLTVNVTATDGTATGGQDYIGGSLQLVFTPGETQKSFFIPIIDDFAGEGDETVLLHLTTSGGNGFPGIGDATLIIEDNDFHPGYIQFEPMITALDEAAGTVQVTVRRTSGAEGTVAVDVSTVLGTASDADLIGFAGTLVFGPGQTTNTFEVSINDDDFVEAPETFTVILSNPTGGAQLSLTGPTELEFTIVDNDLGPGSLDQSFDPGSGFDNTNVFALLLQPDGKVVVGGGFSSFDGHFAPQITRVLSNGQFDTNFNPGSGPSGPVYALDFADTNRGTITVGGDFRSFNSQDRLFVARVTAGGALDPSMSQLAGLNASVLALQGLPDTKVLLGGEFNVPANHIARINASGSLDVSFNVQNGADGNVNDIKRTLDGKVVIGGTFTNVGGFVRRGIARLLANGLVDTSFNTPNATSVVYRVVPLIEGQVLVAGDMLIDGQVSRITRLNSDGTRDTNFMASADGPVYAVGFQRDGKLIIAGDFSQVDGEPRNNIARLLADGTIDTSFDAALTINGPIRDLEIQPDGRIVIGGAFTEINGFSRNGIARINGQEAARDITITEVALKGSDIRITFASQTGFTYDIEGTSDFQTWVMVRTVTADSKTTQVDLPVPTVEGYQFFRVSRATP